MLWSPAKITAGILPDSRFESNMRYLTKESLPNSLGIVPTKSFPAREMEVRDKELASWVGMVPVNPPCEMLNPSKRERLAN